MKTKFQNLMDKIAPYLVISFILILWQTMSILNLLPEFLIPSPFSVVKAFYNDFFLIMSHTKVTLIEAFTGLMIGTILAFILSIVMDTYNFIYKAIMPVLVVTQTIPTVAIAPLLIIWMGYGLTPKIFLVVITTFFPITIALLDGYRAVEKEQLILLKVMGANRFQEYVHIKLPNSLSHFLAGFRVSVSYSLIGAVVSEWLGGFNGLGVYMTRVRKAFALDKMFAIIFFISILSLVLMFIVSKFEKFIIKWEEK